MLIIALLFFLAPSLATMSFALIYFWANMKRDVSGALCRWTSLQSLYTLNFHIIPRINMICSEMCADLNSAYKNWGTFRLHVSVSACWNWATPSMQQADQIFLKVNFEVMTPHIYKTGFLLFSTSPCHNFALSLLGCSTSYQVMQLLERHQDNQLKPSRHFIL